MQARSREVGEALACLPARRLRYSRYWKLETRPCCHAAVASCGQRPSPSRIADTACEVPAGGKRQRIGGLATWGRAWCPLCTRLSGLGRQRHAQVVHLLHSLEHRLPLHLQGEPGSHWPVDAFACICWCLTSEPSWNRAVAAGHLGPEGGSARPSSRPCRKSTSRPTSRSSTRLQAALALLVSSELPGQSSGDLAFSRWRRRAKAGGCGPRPPRHRRQTSAGSISSRW